MEQRRKTCWSKNIFFFKEWLNLESFHKNSNLESLFKAFFLIVWNFFQFLIPFLKNSLRHPWIFSQHPYSLNPKIRWRIIIEFFPKNPLKKPLRIKIRIEISNIIIFESNAFFLRIIFERNSLPYFRVKTVVFLSVNNF